MQIERPSIRVRDEAVMCIIGGRVEKGNGKKNQEIKQRKRQLRRTDRVFVCLKEKNRVKGRVLEKKQKKKTHEETKKAKLIENGSRWKKWRKK